MMQPEVRRQSTRLHLLCARASSRVIGVLVALESTALAVRASTALKVTD